jgi:hypothetical protein
MSEYYLFVDADKKTSRANEPHELKEGESMYKVADKKVTYTFHGVSFTIPIPDEIVDDDDDIAAAVAVHRRNQKPAKKEEEKPKEEASSSIPSSSSDGDKYEEPSSSRPPTAGGGDANADIHDELTIVRRDMKNLHNSHVELSEAHDAMKRQHKKDMDALRSRLTEAEKNAELHRKSILDLSTLLKNLGAKPLE